MREDTAAVGHLSDSGFSSSESGDGDALRRKRTAKKTVERTSVAETQPATDPTVRSVLDRAAEIDWHAVKHKENKKKVSTTLPDEKPTSPRRLHILIGVGSLTVLAISMLLFAVVGNRDPETPDKAFEEISDTDLSLPQGTTSPPRPEESAAVEKKDDDKPKSTFSLDDLDATP
jgi:hypothetical protein